MAKSAWMAHLQKFRKDHPNMSVPEAAKAAAKTYKKQAGGSAMGGDLSPTNFNADPNFPTSGSAKINVDATQYSTGGAKKSRKSKSKSRKSKSRSHKRH